MNNVLVLNQTWEPLAVARIGRALSLLDGGRAEAIEHYMEPIRTSSCMIPRPCVIRLVNFIKRPRPRVRYTRQNVFKRDDFQCQFCGTRPRELTIDHVMPTSRGGADWWDNAVSACVKCNRKKGARTPEEAHMPLKQKPVEPRMTGYLHLFNSDTQPEWIPFMPAVM